MALRDCRLKRRDWIGQDGAGGAATPGSNSAECKRARRPPNGDVSSRTSPPWLRATSRAIVRPSPTPPVDGLRDASSRTNGLEDPFAFRLGDARPVIVDQDIDRRHRPARSTARHAGHGGAHWRSGCRGSAAAHSAGPAKPVRRPARAPAACRRAAPPRPNPRSAARYRSRPGFRCLRRGRNRGRD